MQAQNFMRVEEVAQELGISKSHAYKVIHKLNAELREKGYLTISGRVNRNFFMEKFCYYDMREVSDRLCKENGLSVIPPSQNKGMGYKEYTEAKRGTSWKQKLKQTIDRLVITAKDYDDFLRLDRKSVV